MRELFKSTPFNTDISKWNTSQVTTMHQMYFGASYFNQDIGAWDTSLITDMQGMFCRAFSFNQNIGMWDTSQVTSTREMFLQAVMFNQNIGAWNTSLIADMQGMFSMALHFDHYIGNWSVRQVVTMQNILEQTTLISNICHMHRIARKWGRDVGRGGSDAFKRAYPTWKTEWSDNTLGSESCGNKLCLPGFFCDGNVTYPCAVGHWCPSDTISRAAQKPCPRGKYGHPLPLEATKGYALEETACGMCLPGRYGNATGRVGKDAGCIKCPNGRTSAFGAPTCYLICPELGYFWDEGTGNCTACPAGKALPTLGSVDRTSCVTCKAGSVAPYHGSAYCRQCGVGTPCDLGSFAGNNMSGFCLKCGIGTHSSENRRLCVKCLAGTASLGGTTECAPCAPGSFSSSNASGFCLKCASGRFSAAYGASSCSRCAVGAFQDSVGATECKPCGEGSVSDQGATHCQKCAPGRYHRMLLRPPGCVLCTPGSISSVGAVECKQCTIGRFMGFNRTRCEPCPVGTWSDALGAARVASCRPCPRGSFSSTPGLDTAAKCNECPPGKHSSTVGANSSAHCLPCREGYFSENGGQTACEACISGSSRRGSSYCSDCPGGTEYNITTKKCDICQQGSYSNVGGRCAACFPGTYEQNRVKCVPCPAGAWNDVIGATSDALCRPCRSGTFSSALGLDAADKCNACPPGKHSSVTGANTSNVCTPCKKGYFAKDGGQTSCKACISGFSAPGSSYCSDCPRGKEFIFATKTCESCPPGSISRAGGQCSPCVAGTFDQGHVECMPCPAGTWSDTVGAASAVKCKPCPRGTFSASSGVDAVTKCYFCEEGRFTPSFGSDACARCPDYMTSRSDNATVCIAAKGFILGQVWDKASEVLHPCPESGALCKNQPGARVENLALASGFWRPTHSSLDVRPCKTGSGCIGGVSTGSEGEGVCDNATTGPYCAVCAKDYKRQGGVCVSCDELGGNAAAPLLVLIGVGALIALIASVAYKYKFSMFEGANSVALVGMADHSGDHGVHGRVVEKFKIVYGFAQVVSSTFEEFDLKFPPAFSALASAFSVVNLDIFGFLSMGCVVDVDFYGELMTTCTAPAVFAVLLLGYAKAKSKKGKRTTLQIFTRFYLVLLFCVYSGVTRKIFTTFKCERFVTAGLDEAGCYDKGYAWRGDACYRSYLRADLSLSCDVSEHSSWKAFAVVMAVTYPFGVPVLFACLLYQDKDDTSLSFIRAAYEDRFYWWEVVELGRKLLLTLVIVFFYEGSASQILVTLLVAFGFTLLLRTYKPYKSDDDDFLAAFAQALLVLTSLASLCLKVHITDNDEWNEGTFDFFLTALVVSVPVFALYEALVASGLLQRARCRGGKPKSVAPLCVQPHDIGTDSTPVLIVLHCKYVRERDALVSLRLLASDEPRCGSIVETLCTMIRDIPDKALLERIKLAIVSLQDGCDKAQSAEPTPSADTKYATLGTRFNEHILHAAALDNTRRASALTKAHSIYDEAEAARRAKIAKQRREQKEKLQHRLEVRKKQRAEEQRARAFV